MLKATIYFLKHEKHLQKSRWVTYIGLYFLQSFLIIWTLFSGKNKLSDLLDRTDRNFWRVDQFVITEKDKSFCNTCESRIKWAFYFLSVIHISCLLTFYLPPFFAEGDVLAISCYRPPWMTLFQLRVFQGAQVAITQMLPSQTILMLLTNLMNLTQIQFRLLNVELRNIFHVQQKKFEIQRKVAEIVCHHNFLVR